MYCNEGGLFIFLFYLLGLLTRLLFATGNRRNGAEQLLQDDAADDGLGALLHVKQIDGGP